MSTFKICTSPWTWIPLCSDSSSCLQQSINHWRIGNIDLNSSLLSPAFFPVSVISLIDIRLQACEQKNSSVWSSMYYTLDRFVLFDEKWGALKWSGQINGFARDRPTCSIFHLSGCVGHRWLIRQYDSNTAEGESCSVMVCGGQRSKKCSSIQVVADRRVKKISMSPDFCSFFFDSVNQRRTESHWATKYGLDFNRWLGIE